MPTLKSLELEFPILDSSFQRFCASNGVLSVEDFLLCDVYVLVALAEDEPNSEELKQGITQVLEIIDALHQPWLNGMELLEDAQQNKYVLSTGCEEIDFLLKGGLCEGQLTELAGQSSSGKTQICLLAASSAAYKYMASVVFFDTCNSFSPRRIAYFINQVLNPTLQQVKHGSLKRIMSNIFCKSVFDIFGLLDALAQLQVKLRSQLKMADIKVRLLVIDSISSLIAPVLGGSGAHGWSLMISAGFLLKKIAYEHNLSVLVTNHMVGGEGGRLKPALGESWKVVPHTRLLLSCNNRSNARSISILKHSSVAYGESANFKIEEENI